MSVSSYKRRKAHREMGRLVKEGKATEEQTAQHKTAEEKRQAKLKAAGEKKK